MTRTEMVLQTLVYSPFNHLTRQVAREYLISLRILFIINLFHLLLKHVSINFIFKKVLELISPIVKLYGEKIFRFLCKILISRHYPFSLLVSRLP
jgi:hypothetical protein